MWLMWPYLKVKHGMEEKWVVDGEGKHDVAHVTLP